MENKKDIPADSQLSTEKKKYPLGDALYTKPKGN
jgi:hypothetical protein